MQKISPLRLLKLQSPAIAALLLLPGMVFAQTATGTSGEARPTDPTVIETPATETQPTTPPEDPAAVTTPPQDAVAPETAPTSPTPQPATTAAPQTPPQTAPLSPAAPPSEDNAPSTLSDAATLAASSLEDIGEAADVLSEKVPSVLKPVFAAIASTIAAMIAFLGLWEWGKRLKEKKTKKCARCGASTHEGPCATCNGTKTVEEEYETTIKCPHCKGTGVDPCHHCGGTGKMSMPNPPQSAEELESWPPCDFCGGSGKKRIGAGHDLGDANATKENDQACCMCHGKKEETIKAKRQVPCPDCQGK